MVGAPISLTPQFQRFGVPAQAPFQTQQQPRRGGGVNPLALALAAAGRGLVEGGSRGGLGTALLGATSAAVPAFMQGQLANQQRQDEQAKLEAQQQQQALENLQAQAEADRKAAADAEKIRQFGVTTGLKQQTEQRLLTKDQRDAQDIAFKQDNARQQLQLNQAKFRLDQATSAPEKIQIMQAMGLDPASPEGRELLTASLTKPQVQINQPKLSPGQIPIDPNDLSKGSVSAKEIGKAREIAAGIKTNIGRYADTLREFGAETFPGTAKDQLKSQRTQLLFDLKTLNELGALQGPDLELMADLLLDPTAVSTRVGNAFAALGGASLGERALANLDVLQQQVDDRLNAITGLVGAPTAPAQQATPADLSQMSTEQLLQLQGSLSAGNP